MAGFDGPVTVGRVDIGMAYSTGLDLDDDFTSPGVGFGKSSTTSGLSNE